MRIAIIGHKRIPSSEGGIEKGVEEHAVRMAALGHSVTVYNRGGHNIYGKQYDTKRLKEYKGVRIVTVPAPRGAACVPVYSFLAIMHAAFHRYDVISIRASGPCAIIPLAKLFRLRVVASLHGIDSQRDKWGGFASRYLEFGERMAARKADVCLVLSRNMKEYMDSRYHTDTVRFANGIDRPATHCPEIILDKYGLKKDEYILSLGRIVPEKGLQYLIRAFRNCSTDKKLVIAGASNSNADYYQQLLELAKDDRRIIFTGYVTGQLTQELYSNAYLFAMPSNLEGMANALLEAMSYGNCCLVSDIPENTEVTGHYAVQFPKGDEAQLQQKLQQLLDDPQTVAQYKSQAADYVCSRYQWDLIVEQMLRVYSGDVVDYEQILAEHTAAAAEETEA